MAYRKLRFASGGASQQRTRLWNQAIGRILFELFFSLYAREGRNENPPLLARQETGISFADIRSIGPSGPSVIVTVLKENA